MEKLSDRVRRGMRDAGLTQDQLEKAAGLSQGYVSRLLSGQKKSPRAAELGKLADALGVSLDWLQSGKGEPRPAGAAVPKAPGPVPAPPRIQPLSVEDNPFETALETAFRSGDYRLQTLNAVQAAIRESRTRIPVVTEQELVRIATSWLRAAQGLQAHGEPVTMASLARWLGARISPEEAVRDEAITTDLNARADAGLRGVGVEPKAPKTPPKR